MTEEIKLNLLEYRCNCIDNRHRLLFKYDKTLVFNQTSAFVVGALDNTGIQIKCKCGRMHNIKKSFFIVGRDDA